VAATAAPEERLQAGSFLGYGFGILRVASHTFVYLFVACASQEGRAMLRLSKEAL
jgi:hypothetical protein